MPSKFALLIVSISTLMLSACGGGSSAPSVMVSNIQANQLKYSQATQFTITGYSLDKDINVSTQNCKSLALVAGGIFVAQGGWLTPTPAVQAGQKAAIALEVNKGLSNLKGSIAMARSSELNSATSQYYFNLADNVALDTSSGGYAVFGKVVSGIEVLDAMLNVKTITAYGLADFPASSVIVLTATQTK